MDKILVHGGHPLSGSIKISGSKNSALPILAATLLTKEPCVLRHVPDLSDTHYMLQILTASRRGSGAGQRHGHGEGGEDRIGRALRSRAQNARVGLRARAAAGPLQGGDRLAARRLRHRRSADRFASKRLRSARRGGPGGKRKRESFRAETDGRGRSICAANSARPFSEPTTS